jgi:hypothetical protein
MFNYMAINALMARDTANCFDLREVFKGRCLPFAL